jgi:hypothetical protein
MAIITADNYMDETFFSLSLSLSLSLSSRRRSSQDLFRKHTIFFVFLLWNCEFSLTLQLNVKEEISKEMKKKNQRKRRNRYNWRQKTEFIYDKPMQS